MKRINLPSGTHIFTIINWSLGNVFIDALIISRMN